MAGPDLAKGLQNAPGGKTAKEFKEFLLRGNVVDLAVGVVIGAAFGKVVTSLIDNLVTPLVGIPGGVDFKDVAYHMQRGDKELVFGFGTVLTDLITFVILAAVIFLVVVKPMNHLMAMATRSKAAAEEAAPTEKECPECLSEIPVAAKRCKFCTASV